MRIVLVFMALLLGCLRLQAEPVSPSADSERRPTGADVIAQLYQFDLFQQSALDSADTQAPEVIVNMAALRSDAAAKRDKELSDLQQRIGITVAAPHKSGAMRAHALLGADNVDAAAYVRQFHEAQLSEYEIIVALLARYLEHPDNDEVRVYVEKELPVLRNQLTESRGAMSDKDK